MFKQQELPARACTLEDFGTHPEGAKVYKEWNGYSMICPDFTNFDIKKTRLDSQTWLLRGSMSSFRISRGEFVIERCQEKYLNKGEKCEKHENINTFLSDLQADTWIFQEKIDYLKYFEKPIFKIVEYVRGGILDNPEKLERSVIYLRRHEIDTEDDYF